MWSKMCLKIMAEHQRHFHSTVSKFRPSSQVCMNKRQQLVPGKEGYHSKSHGFCLAEHDVFCQTHALSPARSRSTLLMFPGWYQVPLPGPDLHYAFGGSPVRMNFAATKGAPRRINAVPRLKYCERKFSTLLAFSKTWNRTAEGIATFVVFHKPIWIRDGSWFFNKIASHK